MFKFKLHETINSVGVLISILLGLAVFRKQYEESKENIIFTANIQNGDFKSKLAQNNRGGGVLITLKYKLLITNLSSTSTSIVDATAYNSSSSNDGQYTDYEVASDPLDKPIYLTAGKAENLNLDVRVPISARCSADLGKFGSETSFLVIIKALAKNRDCLTNIFEPYSRSGFDATFDPKDNSSEVTYAFHPPTTFQLKTAGGNRYSKDTSAFLVNFRGSDGRVMPR